ncbi:MAG: hypothetical protein CXX76_02515 [Methanobacteriota archaeon]|nr:MAG: hypothetical protein CXX76_02515 [Euryarchaeota archaeon]
MCFGNQGAINEKANFDTVTGRNQAFTFQMQADVCDVFFQSGVAGERFALVFQISRTSVPVSSATGCPALIRRQPTIAVLHCVICPQPSMLGSGVVVFACASNRQDCNEQQRD